MYENKEIGEKTDCSSSSSKSFGEENNPQKMPLRTEKKEEYKKVTKEVV